MDIISIRNFLDHLEYPLVDGIIYPEGRIDFVALLPDCEIYPHIQVDGGGETSVEILADRGQLQWNSAAIMGSNVSEDGRHYAVCGEANWGSDGFIALISTDTGEARWLASFTFSNPFRSVRFTEGSLYAESTLGNVWHFPLDNPSRVKIIA